MLWATVWMDFNLHPCSPSPVSRAPYCLCVGNWKDGGDWEGAHLSLQGRTNIHFPPSLKSPLSAWHEDMGSPASHAVSTCCPSLRDGRAWLHNLSHSHSLVVLSLATASFSSATMLSKSFTCSHLTEVLALPLSIASARLLPSLQPGAEAPTCLCGASALVPTSTGNKLQLGCNHSWTSMGN